MERGYAMSTDLNESVQTGPSLGPPAKGGWLEKTFHLSKRNTNVKTEFIAGLTTFMTMSYIIFVNPAILHDAGIPKEAALAATIYSSVIATVLFALWANMPVAVAPGMGLNAFFYVHRCTWARFILANCIRRRLYLWRGVLYPDDLRYSQKAR